jgi:uncharacterized protein YndB with AHSA1/START domain
MSSSRKSNEIHIHRVYDAPVEAVWDAWTDVKQVAKWWGPRGFSLTTHSKELKPGGIWHYTMHGPDGVDYPNKTLYHEVEPLARLVYDHGGHDERAPLFRVTVTFEEVNGRTHMDMRMALATPEAAEETRKLIRKAGGNTTWDRLAEYLEHTTKGKDVFVINRSFDCPIERMFEMWTDPRHFASWMGPAGAEMHFFRAEIRPGGSTFYEMSGPGMQLFGRASYLEIRKPDRIVYTQQFCDANENVIRHPMAPVWPETMLTEVTLTEEGPDQTRVSVVWEPCGECTREELEAFMQARDSMTGGWTGSFDKLDAALSSS